jgi:uncharacterized membrane protein
MNQQYPMTDAGPDLGKWLAGAAAGALLMYMLDPDRGRMRRSQTTDKLVGMGKQTGEKLTHAWERVGSRFSSAAGDAIESASRIAESVKPDGAAGRTVSEPASGTSRAAGAGLGGIVEQVTDSAGPIAARVRSAMQGVRSDWAPGMRSSAMVGGGLLGLYGLMRRSPLGIVASLAGLALLARGATNRPLGSMLRGQGLGQSFGRAIDLQKTIHIDASPDEVYELWSNYENFPRFMSHVNEVRDLGRGRSHWVVSGPAGSQFAWDSVLTEQSRPRRLAWRSEPGAEIPNNGSVQFEPARGGTDVTVRMSYTPPAGALGHGLASLLGVDPKRQMDDDLARMKAFIERGMVQQRTAPEGKSASRFLH